MTGLKFTRLQGYSIIDQIKGPRYSWEMDKAKNKVHPFSHSPLLAYEAYKEGLLDFLINDERSIEESGPNPWPKGLLTIMFGFPSDEDDEEEEEDYEEMDEEDDE